MSSLAICWDEERRMWLVIDMDIRAVVERFDHLLDAGWYVQSESREAKA